MERFRVTGSAMCGLQLAYGADAQGVPFALGGTMDLRDGEVDHNAVCGANIQTDGFDLERLLDSVLFHDSAGQNFDGDALPVPNAGESVRDE